MGTKLCADDTDVLLKGLQHYAANFCGYDDFIIEDFTKK